MASAEASTALPKDTTGTPPAYTDNVITPTLTSTEDAVATPYTCTTDGALSQLPLGHMELLTLFQVTFKSNRCNAFSVYLVHSLSLKVDFIESPKQMLKCVLLRYLFK